ncbi:MAG: flap endonuclease [Myxococcales bacterium]|nr:flap endonuclease [Myxococcales bacterium]
MSPILVDGTFELFRAFFGAPSALAHGAEVGATRAFLRSMIALLRTTGCRHVGVAFDHVIESFRNQLFAGYKTGAGIDPALWSQFPLVEEATSALGLATWPMIDHEADDALATAAAALAEDPRVSVVRIASPDKDLTQCVIGSRVVCWDRLRDKVLDEAGVIGKFGVPPSSIPDYLALVGDEADGIPGVPGWGARSSATVLAAYLHLEHIPRHQPWSVAVRGAARLAASLEEHRDAVLLYRQLATLRRDSPIECRLEALRWRGVNAEALAALCARLELDIGSLRLPPP